VRDVATAAHRFRKAANGHGHAIRNDDSQEAEATMRVLVTSGSDFSLRGQPLYLNPQLAFGFGLYASNTPMSFLEEQEENRSFYAPLVFVGAKL